VRRSEVEDATLFRATGIVNGPSRRVIAWTVWGIWAVMTIAALAFVWRFGSDVPFWDEWNIVNALTGAQPITIKWLWALHNGHRILLPKLLLLGLYKVSGGDFRVGMYFNVAALAAIAAAMIWASQRIRQGEPSYVDAVFPLLLLHLGHYENLLWSWQVTQIFPVIVVCGLLAVIAVYAFAPPTLAMVVAAIGVMTLPLSGIPGLAYAPVLVCWLAVTAIRAYSRGKPRAAIALWVAAITTLILIVLYFHHYRSDTHLSLLKAPRLELKTAVIFVSGGLGPISSKLWPASGGLTMLLMLGTLLALAWKGRTWDQQGARAKALLIFFAAAACLVASFAFGRTGTGFVGRYSVLAAPVWCVTILALIVAFPAGMSRLVQFSLIVVLLLVTPVNVSASLRYAHEYNRRMKAFLVELQHGAPPEELVAHHVTSLCPCAWGGFAKAGLHQKWGGQAYSSGFPLNNCVSYQEWITACLRQLHDAKIGIYGRMNVQSHGIREIIPSPQTGFAITRAEATAPHPDAADQAVLLTPEHPLYIAGVRVRRPSGSSYVPPDEVWGQVDAKGRWVQVFWRLRGQADYMAPNRYVFLWDPGKDEQIAWIFGTIEQIALHFGDRPVQRSLRFDDLPITVLLPTDR
jgi:hypothetical protein